jgi:hypothetical protein
MSGSGCMPRWNPPRAPESFSCCRLWKDNAWRSSCSIYATSWEKVRSESSWTVRAVIGSFEVAWPQDMHPLYLPPYSPELNQAWQIFRHIRKNLSNTVFTTLDELQNALIDQLQQFWEHPTVLLQLTGYPWWVEAVNSNIASSS